MEKFSKILFLILLESVAASIEGVLVDHSASNSGGGAPFIGDDFTSGFFFEGAIDFGGEEELSFLFEVNIGFIQIQSELFTSTAESLEVNSEAFFLVKAIKIACDLLPTVSII